MEVIKHLQQQHELLNHITSTAMILSEHYYRSYLKKMRIYDRQYRIIQTIANFMYDCDESIRDFMIDLNYYPTTEKQHNAYQYIITHANKYNRRNISELFITFCDSFPMTINHIYTDIIITLEKYYRDFKIYEISQTTHRTIFTREFRSVFAKYLFHIVILTYECFIRKKLAESKINDIIGLFRDTDFQKIKLISPKTCLQEINFKYIANLFSPHRGTFNYMLYCAILEFSGTDPLESVTNLSSSPTNLDEITLKLNIFVIQQYIHDDDYENFALCIEKCMLQRGGYINSDIFPEYIIYDDIVKYITKFERRAQYYRKIYYHKLPRQLITLVRELKDVHKFNQHMIELLHKKSGDVIYQHYFLYDLCQWLLMTFDPYEIKIPGLKTFAETIFAYYNNGKECAQK